MGLVAPQHLGSSWIRDRFHLPCADKRTLIYCATREVLLCHFKKGLDTCSGLAVTCNPCHVGSGPRVACGWLCGGVPGLPSRTMSSGAGDRACALGVLALYWTLGCLPILCDLVPEAGCSGLEGAWFGLEDGLLKANPSGLFILMKSIVCFWSQRAEFKF